MSNDTTTIPDELRIAASWEHSQLGMLFEKAADEIDRLTAQVAMLREALEGCSGVLEDLHGGRDPGNCDEIFYSVEAALTATQASGKTVGIEIEKGNLR